MPYDFSARRTSRTLVDVGLAVTRRSSACFALAGVANHRVHQLPFLGGEVRAEMGGRIGDAPRAHATAPLLLGAGVLLVAAAALGVVDGDGLGAAFGATVFAPRAWRSALLGSRATPRELSSFG